jgi:CubicO group peptidase (beta-lactamase class C family)
VVVVLSALVSATGCRTSGEAGLNLLGSPIHELSSGQFIQHWLVLGPFPNPPLEQPGEGGVTRGGYIVDYLAELGGEPAATFSKDTKLTFKDSAGATKTAAASEVKSGGDGFIDLAAVFGFPVDTVAYALAYVVSPRAQQAECYFGSDDWPKVWVNGDLVHALWQVEGRSCDPMQDHFSVKLRKGPNRVLIKVEQHLGSWSFAFRIMTAEDGKAFRAEREFKEKLRAFQNAKIRAHGKDGYIFPPGPLPKLEWERPEIVRDLYGDMPMTVRWFDAQQNEVTKAIAPGRYAAYVECVKPDGSKIRRAFTFFCRPAEWTPWSIMSWYRADAPYIRLSTVDKAVWDEQRNFVGTATARALIDQFLSEEFGAVFLAGMSEIKPLGRAPTQLDEPSMLDEDYHVRLKRRLLGVENKYPPLAPPRQKSGAPATVLHSGGLGDAGFKPELVEKVRAVCRDWFALEGQPLTVLVARHGVIAMHEAFGEARGNPVTVNTKFPLASLTKCHAGLMLAQFLDQGIMNLDDPVGKYIPDFPTKGDKAITLRQCMAHTTGFEGHGDFRGMENPWLDNVLANGVETLKPGAKFLYNGMGFDLAGKVMEIVSGKSFFRLMHENFFIPLGQDNPTMVDLGFGIDCTVMDLARVGQLLLNKGAYGNVRFFSEETFERVIRPRPLKEFFPKIEGMGDYKYNLGLNTQEDTREDDNPADNVPPARLFSDNSLGHGAASGAILRVDLDKDLVIAVSRFEPGNDYNKYCTRLLTAIVDAVE